MANYRFVYQINNSETIFGVLETVKNIAANPSQRWNENFNCSGFAKGIYVVLLETESDHVVRKFFY